MFRCELGVGFGYIPFLFVWNSVQAISLLIPKLQLKVTQNQDFCQNIFLISCEIRFLLSFNIFRAQGMCFLFVAVCPS